MHITTPFEIEIAKRFLECQLKEKRRVKAPGSSSRPLKHIIEAHAGRYIPEDAVRKAANLLGLPATYPSFGIGKLVLPPPSIYDGIAEAFTHPNYMDKIPQYVEAGDFFKADVEFWRKARELRGQKCQ